MWSARGHSSDWLMWGQHHQPSCSNQSDVSMLGGCTQSPFPSWRGFLCKSVLCISWGRTRTCLRASVLLLDHSSPVYTSPPFPDQQLFGPALWGGVEAVTKMRLNWFTHLVSGRARIGPQDSFFFLFGCSVVSDSLQPHGLHHASLPSPSLFPRVCSNSCPLSWWCHPIISSSAIPFSSCPQSFPASGSFPLSWLFASGGRRIGASTSASVLPMNIQGWFPLGLTGLISLLSKGLSRFLPSCLQILPTSHSLLENAEEGFKEPTWVSAMRLFYCWTQHVSRKVMWFLFSSVELSIPRANQHYVGTM